MTVTLPFGVDFRATAGFVTDVAPNVNEVGTTADYSAARGYGWETIPNAVTGRDRNAALDPQLAGIQFCPNAVPSPNVFRIDVPVGGCAIRVALGDTAGESDQNLAIFDGATLVKQVASNNGTGANQWIDATGVLRTSASDWLTNNQPVLAAVSSGILRFNLGGVNSGAFNSTLAHIGLASANLFAAALAPMTVTRSGPLTKLILLPAGQSWAWRAQAVASIGAFSSRILQLGRLLFPTGGSPGGLGP